MKQGMKTVRIHDIDLFTDDSELRMIEGVAVKSAKAHSDDRGFIVEVLKEGEESFHLPKQASYTETEPGVVKAFHWHKRQWDIWYVLGGSAEIVLYDQRAHSSTKGVTNVIVSRKVARCVVAIPPGVAHGYRVLGNKPVKLMYYTTEVYDPKNPDEERILWNDPTIGYDWETKNR